MEVSVSFTDGNTDLNIGGASYITDSTVLGRVWIPAEGLILTPPLRVRYEKHPWMETFELDGIRPAPARRTGLGTKNARGFVRSLSTIYSRAYDDYLEFGGDDSFDAAGYFRHAAEHFARMANDQDKSRMYAKFCGFTENMWREGDEEILEICLGEVVPVLQDTGSFRDNITEEFRVQLDRLREQGS